MINLKKGSSTVKANYDHQKVALVTGAARGIGLAAAKSLAMRGFDVALNDLEDDEELQNAVKTIEGMGRKAVGVAADIGDISCHQHLIERAHSKLGSLTTLANNAGVSVLNRGDLLDVTEESYDRCLRINTKGPFFLSQAFARYLIDRPRRGMFLSIINITSANAAAVAVQRGEYCVSKAAAAMMSQVFAVRLGKENIAVFDVRPGLIRTNMTKTVIDVYQRRIDEEGLTLLPRMGEPGDVGAVVATLAAGDMPYMTGQAIAVDAGMLVQRF